MEKKSTLNEGVYSFISRNRKLLLVAISIIMLGFLGLGIFALVSYQMNMDAIAVVDRASIRFEKWGQLESSAAQFLELEEEIKNILRPFTNPRAESYAGSKALWILSSMAEKKQNVSDQKEKLIQLLKWYPNSPYNMQASYKLAQLYLDEGSTLESIKVFEEILKYRDIPALFKEEVLFTLGVLYESLDPAKSRNYFDELVQTYPLSDWTKLTRSRIIYQDLLK